MQPRLTLAATIGPAADRETFFIESGPLLEVSPNPLPKKKLRVGVNPFGTCRIFSKKHATLKMLHDFNMITMWLNHKKVAGVKKTTKNMTTQNVKGMSKDC